MENQPTSPPPTTRRRFLTILAVAGGVGIAWALARRSRPSALGEVRQSRLAMGTLVNLTVMAHDRPAAEEAIEAVWRRIEDLETKLSPYRPDSEISKLNKLGELGNASDDLLAVVRQSLRIGQLGGGAFDVTILPLVKLFKECKDRNDSIPSQAAVRETLQLVDYTKLRVDGGRIWFERPGMAITVDGIGKGYAVDQAVEVLKRAGFENVLVNAGGDLAVAGQPARDRPWRIGIQSPRREVSDQMVSVEVRDQAMATSGDYMQAFTEDREHHHILDPRTGYSSGELASSTVIAPTAAEADALATLLMVVGSQKAIELLEPLAGCEAYMISKRLDVSRTSGFEVSLPKA